MPSPFDSPDRHNGKGLPLGSRANASRLDLEGDGASEKPDRLNEFRESLKGLHEAVTEFGQARIDGIRVSARNFILKAALGAIGAIAAVVFLAVAMTLLLVGLAGGTARLLDAPLWAGYLIVGAVCVGIPSIALWFKSNRIKARWLRKLKDKYDRQSEVQQAK